MWYTAVRNKSLTKEQFDALIQKLMELRHWTTPYYHNRDFNPKTDRMWWHSYPRNELAIINMAHEGILSDIRKFAKINLLGDYKDLVEVKIEEVEE